MTPAPILCESHSDAIAKLQDEQVEHAKQLARGEVHFTMIRQSIEDLSKRVTESFDRMQGQVESVAASVAAIKKTQDDHHEQLKALIGDAKDRAEQRKKVKKFTWAAIGASLVGLLEAFGGDAWHWLVNHLSGGAK